MTNWPPSPCDPGPPPGAAFNVVNNAGLRSATYATWNGCRVYLGDQGTPDADGLPTHVGTSPGLWVFDLGGTADFGCDEVRIYDGCEGDPDLDDGLVDAREIVTMDVVVRNHGAPLSNVVATFASPAPEVTFRVRDISTPPDRVPDDSSATPTISSSGVVGTMPTGTSLARVQFAWDSVACPRAPIPFTLSFTANGAPVATTSHWLTAVDPECVIGPYDLPGGEPTNLAPLVSPSLRTSGYLPASCAGGASPVVVEWTQDFPDLARFNLYRGLLYTLLSGTFDHVTVPSTVGFANLACDDQYGPAGPAPDGACEHCDPDESGANFYYLMTSETDCAAAPPLKGREGSTGKNSLGVERPMGGGSP